MFNQNNEEVKLEWMYKAAHSTVEREEYLLGRSVDKTLEQLNEEEKQKTAGIVIQQPKNHVEHECIPPSIRDYRQQTGDQVDMTAKLQEDPLIAIKKREDENRRQFLNNPIQIKKLQKALKSQKKQKKKEKKKDNSDSDSDLDRKLTRKLKLLKDNSSTIEKPSKKSKEENNLDTILMHKYNQLKTKLSDDDLNDILQGKVSSDSSSSDDEDEINSRKVKHKTKKSKGRSVSDDDDDDIHEHKKEKLKRKRDRTRSRSKERSKHNSKNCRRSRSRSPYNTKHNNKSKTDSRNDRRRHSKRDNSEEFKSKDKRKSTTSRNKIRKTSESHSNDESEVNVKSDSRKHYKRSPSYSFEESDSGEHSKKKNWGLVKADGSKIPLKAKTTKDIYSTRSQHKKSETDMKVAEKPKRSILTEDEKERRRKEMMENAAWRDSERSKNVKCYREEILREDQEQKSHNPEFIQRELLKSANSSSVESRIKANISNIQRSGNDMNKHFSRR